MTRWAALIPLLLLLSCTPSSHKATLRPVDVPVDVPRDLRACAPAPDPPPLPRTIEQIGKYTHSLGDAHDDCVKTLRRLNRWLSDKTVVAHAPAE